MRVSGFVLVGTVIAAHAVSAAWNPSGVDLTRPRLLLRSSEIASVQARIAGEPYRRIVIAMMSRTRLADDVALDDHSIASERFKARAAKNLAFLYAIDRILIDGQVVPFPSPADRTVVGERVRDLLVSMYTRSRLAVPPPLGGPDRDISTSEELLQYATAYDTMLGAGFDFGADATTITDNIAALAGELYDNYLHPESANNYTLLHQNNHRSKTGAALVIAGIALADYSPEAAGDPRGIREPSDWIDYGLGLVDLILRYGLVTGDGAYGEGPFYYRYTAQNVLPLARAWDRLVGRDYTARDLVIPNLWHHPLFLRSQQWMLDMTLPDGSLAPFDDGNPGRAYYFGAAPSTPSTEAAFAWRWANAPAAYEADGNVDLGADSIVNLDHAVTPAAPMYSPTSFYIEGGNAMFRSDWGVDAVQALVLGEHDTASEFGRDREGRGLSPESHEHAEPGAFLLNAFGETLALDPGYLDFAARTMVNQPEDHNVILVDGKGPVDYLNASFAWQQTGLMGRPPADGQSTLSDALDGDFVDAVRVTSRYGQPAARAAVIDRRFLFADNRYLLIADRVQGPATSPPTFTWLLHGNGGGDSGGTFEQLANGGRWTRTTARLDSAIAFNVNGVTFETDTAVHEAPGREQRTHTVLKAQATGRQPRSMQVLYPTRTAEKEPDITTLALGLGTAIVLVDEGSDRRLVTWNIAASVFATLPGFRKITTDGDVVVVDTHLDGRLRLAWADNAHTIEYGDEIFLESSSRGSLGVRLSDARAEMVAPAGASEIRVYGPPFTVRAIDGACSSETDLALVLHLNRERRIVLRADDGNAQPGADPGPDQRVAVGTNVALDGSASCDSDGDALTPHWELLSAPAGSSWQLDNVQDWHPTLHADRVGPYRVRLVVTDLHGLASRPNDVLVIAGEQCADGLDDDLDGLFDSDDPDCDARLTAPTTGCAGDCDDLGRVTVANLVRCVNITLGRDQIAHCNACDVDGDGRVLVNEVIAGVNNLLRGCPSE